MRSLGERLNLLRKINGGHMGARKFWREYLPRLKYHNPAIPMIVNRHDQNSSAPTILPGRRGPRPASLLPQQPVQGAAPASDERVVHIDMKDKHSTDILEYFVAETRAKALQPTAEEIAEMQSLEALKKEAAVDRERVRQLRAEKKKEEDMLKRARAAGGMAEQEAS
ncbi:hypothetical protein ACCO45_005221 [Purpureocillium lilacinum]|uniref:Uncharacterized protein n=1 Tax=Purpureocillium lilacinum TaxID=33203 RepID=A0ACC4DX24_PURLI